MKVFVTGGLGFIGSHVVDKLRDVGVDVVVYDQAYNPELKRDDVRYIPASILDSQEMTSAMRGSDAVFHLAAIADVKNVLENPDYAEAINVRGTLNVLEAARKTGVKQVVYGSTTWVYSDAEPEEVDETTALHPPSHLYTATKVSGEYYCKAYSELYGVRTAVLRYGIPYGPRARDGAVVPIFVKKALAGEPLTIAGDGSQYRQFVYVEDLAWGNVKALKCEADHRIFNLDGNVRVTIRQIAETLQGILGDVEIEQAEARPGDFGGKVVSSVRAKDELAWEPTTDFREGVVSYIDWFRRRESQQQVSQDRITEVLSRL